jgi:hypothetical protein
VAFSRKTPTLCKRDTRQLWETNLIHPSLPWMSLCMIVLIVTRKRGDGRYYFALWQTNNNTPNKLLLSESAESCLLRVRSVSFTSRAKGCIKFVSHSCLVSLLHKVGVFLFIRSVVVGLSQSKVISTISSFSSDNQNNHT